jgi:PhnB protein
MKAKKKRVKQREQALTPYLLYNDVGRALKWLEKAFGFQEYGDRYTGDDGTIQHAAMQLPEGGDVFMMGCPGPKYKNPRKLGSPTHLMYVSVGDVEKHYARAKRARAEILEKPNDTFYGARRYGVVDPEGHQWYFAQHDIGK